MLISIAAVWRRGGAALRSVYAPFILLRFKHCPQVLWSRDGLAIVSGLNADAPLGTKLAFASGASG